MIREVQELLFPLTEYYLEKRLELPESQEVSPLEMPQPYRHLLVHQSDMTGRLTDYYDEPPKLKVLDQQVRGNVLTRRVLLYLHSSEKIVEFGEIKIFLNEFEAPIQKKIVQGEAPFGQILTDNKINIKSSPRGYFNIVADQMIATNLSLDLGIALYGRNNRLCDLSGNFLADIVEILPPTAMKEEKAL